jgi:hypothetical protein
MTVDDMFYIDELETRNNDLTVECRELYKDVQVLKGSLDTLKTSFIDLSRGGNLLNSQIEFITNNIKYINDILNEQ